MYVYIYICVCAMCTCMYIYIYIHTYIHTYMVWAPVTDRPRIFRFTYSTAVCMTLWIMWDPLQPMVETCQNQNVLVKVFFFWAEQWDKELRASSGQPLHCLQPFEWFHLHSAGCRVDGAVGRAGSSHQQSVPGVSMGPSRDCLVCQQFVEAASCSRHHFAR